MYLTPCLFGALNDVMMSPNISSAAFLLRSLQIIFSSTINLVHATITLPPNIATTPTPNDSGTKGIKVGDSLEEVYNYVAVQ